MGSGFSSCIASEQSLKGLAIFFPWIVENTENIVAQAEDLSTLFLQTAPADKIVKFLYQLPGNSIPSNFHCNCAPT